jgi:hypothetical protein
VAPPADLSAVVRELVVTGLLFALTATIGLALMVLLFKLGTLGGMTVLFYRGLVLIVGGGLLTLVAALWLGAALKLPVSTAFAAMVLSMSVNLTVLIVLPVTVDRSVSTFLLAYMAEHPNRTFTPAELRTVFDQIYMGDFQQVQRRMDEQTLSGNISPRGNGYVISAQGRGFIRSAKLVSWLFDTDPRFLAPDASAQAQHRDAAQRP